MNNELMGDEKNIIFYENEEGQTKIEVILQDENVWLNVNAIANLFDVQRPAIVKHVNNIYKEEELDKNSTCSILEQVQKEGNFYQKITDIFAECSIDYDKTSEPAKEFYATIQNKFHYEILQGNGKISKKQADDKAEKEYEKYRIIQDKNFISDFDKLIVEAKTIENKM